jgi:hypothetical protein
MIGIDFFADFMVMGLKNYLLSPALDNIEFNTVANSNTQSNTTPLPYNPFNNSPLNF